MKNTFRFAGPLVLGAMLGLPFNLHASNSVNPSNVEITIYDLYLSANTDCSSPIHVFSDPSAAAQNVVLGPTFGSGMIPKGTYNCAILGIRDNISATPATTTDSGNCHVGTPLSPTLQICRPPDNTEDPITHATIPCTSSPMKAYVYMSTTGSLANGNVNNGIWTHGLPGPLLSPIVVTGDRAITFVMDFDGQIVDNGSSCDCQPPVMSAR